NTWDGRVDHSFTDSTKFFAKMNYSRYNVTQKAAMGVDATQQGSGKSLLSSAVAVVATGRPPAMMSAGESEEEWRKRITAALYAGYSTIVIDNLHGMLKSAALDSVLTSAEWRDRILGQTHIVEVANLATWMTTGNNVRLGGDLQRRCYAIRLDPKSPTPWL